MSSSKTQSKTSKSSKSNKNIPDENISFNNLNTLDDYRNVYLNYDVTKNKLSPLADKFEKTIIIAKRAEMISGNGPIFVDVPKGMTDPIEIAELELKQSKNPLIYGRNNNGKVEYWKVRDMIFDLS